jgi:hypothetical protein
MLDSDDEHVGFRVTNRPALSQATPSHPAPFKQAAPLLSTTPRGTQDMGVVKLVEKVATMLLIVLHLCPGLRVPDSVSGPPNRVILGAGAGIKAEGDGSAFPDGDNPDATRRPFPSSMLLCTCALHTGRQPVPPLSAVSESGGPKLTVRV